MITLGVIDVDKAAPYFLLFVPLCTNESGCVSNATRRTVADDLAKYS